MFWYVKPSSNNGWVTFASHWISNRSSLSSFVFFYLQAKLEYTIWKIIWQNLVNLALNPEIKPLGSSPAAMLWHIQGNVCNVFIESVGDSIKNNGPYFSTLPSNTNEYVSYIWTFKLRAFNHVNTCLPVQSGKLVHVSGAHCQLRASCTVVVPLCTLL